MHKNYVILLYNGVIFQASDPVALVIDVKHVPQEGQAVAERLRICFVDWVTSSLKMDDKKQINLTLT